ncbi:probable RNA-dependent RNA polymerase 1 [Cornus florida]|uniref:probable RNA-dependent RNA polymerase 1 n=1 Tax=Cornus florida TaxID=4283 RepID=UPI00289E952F|nr:probable RNA-dependent RNA polymerase 1 [Cornus florida]
MGKTIQVFGFPYPVSAEEVKVYLEEYTDEGTVYALEIRKKGGSRACATVQFTTTDAADHIISLATPYLWYGSSYLSVRKMKCDIIPKPITDVQKMKGVPLHFGCQVSKDKFSVFWESRNVSVKMGNGSSKYYFFLSYLSAEYKLELSDENISNIELRRPHGQAEAFLVFQLLGAPRIYEKLEETSNGQWVRATDFTPSCCIGQSSALCLELPHGSHGFLTSVSPAIESQFILESGNPFSHNLDLVPIMGPPPQGPELPFQILFKISSLVQHGYLPGPSLDINFFRLIDPQRIDIAYIHRALLSLCHLKNCCYEPARWLAKQYNEYLMSQKPLVRPAITSDVGLVYVRRVLITPCKVYFYGPEVNISNRVLRNYPDDIDNFLRVSFVDEELNKLHSTHLSPRIASGNEERRTDIYKRILSTLRNGIVIGSKKFDFLAFSSSQLRDNSAWMFASRNGLTAADIRKWMGDFRMIRNVAKYAARLGQSFSSSTETLNVGRHEVEDIPDVEVESEEAKYVFSDGIGKISADFAQRVAIKCGLKNTPSAFQIRYAGYKGVVAVDPMSSMKLSLRKSMLKYESENTKLDVLAWSKYHPCFLNRQLITLLSTLGVRDRVFEKKQREVVQQLDTILADPLRAQEALELMSPGENTKILREMLLCGYKPNVEPFLSMMLHTFRASKLLDLRIKTRIFVRSGRLMMGCLDETGTLEYGQVFVQTSGGGRRPFYDDSPLAIIDYGSDSHNSVIDGKVFVAKNPCLHPGDVRVLKAVDVPALHHMVDCIVFPQNGKRPHPNECSGSDLDGDDYFVCWDPDLIPRRQIHPMDYSPAPSISLDHEVTIEEVQEYFTNYMLNDSLGIIANAHTIFADKEPLKAMSNPCIELARLHSVAVDFPKTGVPADIPPHLRVKKYPDFMEKPDKPTYESQRVIGKLYREVKDAVPLTSTFKTFTKEVATQSYDPDMEVDGFKNYIDDAIECKSMYDFKLGNLMDDYGITTEAEILSGNIVQMSKYYNKRKEADKICLAIRSLRKEARTWFKTKGSQFEVESVYAKASAWYYVTYHPSFWGQCSEGTEHDHFLSFPWCVYDKLIRIKKDKSRYRTSQMSSLEQKYSNGLSLR